MEFKKRNRKVPTADKVSSSPIGSIEIPKASNLKGADRLPPTKIEEAEVIAPSKVPAADKAKTPAIDGVNVPSPKPFTGVDFSVKAKLNGLKKRGPSADVKEVKGKEVKEATEIMAPKSSAYLERIKKRVK